MPTLEGMKRNKLETKLKTHIVEKLLKMRVGIEGGGRKNESESPQNQNNQQNNQKPNAPP